METLLITTAERSCTLPSPLPHLPILQIEGSVLLHEPRNEESNRGQRFGFGALETAYGIHITTVSMIVSNMTHVFLQQFKGKHAE